MNKNPKIASFLSLIIPGLGQLYCGNTKRGLLTLVAAIIIGNLNLIFILVFIQAGLDSSMGWAYWLPRIGHDVVAIWSITFWVWVVMDAYQCARKN